MKTTHLSDYDIQRFTFDLSTCEEKIIKHIHTCDICKKRAESYSVMSDSIKEIPEPVLDFDLSELVLDQLPTLSKKESGYNYFIYFLIMLSFGVVFFALLYFKNVMGDLFRNISGIPTSFIVSTSLLILTVLGIDTMRSFNKKINMLNF